MTLKYTLSKKIEIPTENVEYNMHFLLHRFIHDMKGCITGWTREKEVDIQTGRISYTCSNSRKDLVPELENFIAKLKESHQVDVIGDLENGFFD